MVTKKRKNLKSSKKTSAKMQMAKQPMMVAKVSYFSWFKTGVLVLVFASLATLVTVNPGTLQQFQASILSSLSALNSLTAVTTDPSSPSNPSSPSIPSLSSGILLSYDANGKNEKKLLDIFSAVFPNTSIRTVAYDSDEGKDLIAKAGLTEVPDILFTKEAFQAEKLSAVVNDLFTVHADYYALNVSLVNPSGQTLISGPLKTEGGIWVGDKKAPITVYVYSDLKCQHCRVNERNNRDDFAKLIGEGIVQMVYLDLPQDPDSIFQSAALACLYDAKKNADGYLSLREKLIDRPNLTKAFTMRELKNAGVAYAKQCHEDVAREMFKARIAEADREGISGVPALYIGKTGGGEFVRFTGDKDFSEYQTVFDHLLGG